MKRHTLSQKKLDSYGKNLILSEPYYKYSSPYGVEVTCCRHEWFLSRKLEHHEQNNEFRRLFKDTCLGTIIKFTDQKRRYVIEHSWPILEFTSLEKAVKHLVTNERK